MGGGASIPLITTTLSEQFGSLVITAPRPHLTAALGAALRAARGPADGDARWRRPRSDRSPIRRPGRRWLPNPSPAPALAWSEADDDSGIMPIRAGEYSDDAKSAPLTAARSPAISIWILYPPRLADVWYRRPVVVAVGTALAVLAIGSGVMIALRHTSSTPNAPTSSVNTAPANPGTSDTRTRRAAHRRRPVRHRHAVVDDQRGADDNDDHQSPDHDDHGANDDNARRRRRNVGRLFPRAPDRPRLFQPEPGYR